MTGEMASLADKRSADAAPARVALISTLEVDGYGSCHVTPRRWPPILAIRSRLGARQSPKQSTATAKYPVISMTLRGFRGDTCRVTAYWNAAQQHRESLTGR